MAKTTRKASELWMVHGKYYDLHDFISVHPGGKLVLQQSVGNDVTALVESHHFDERVFKRLNLYEVTPAEGEVIEQMGYTFDESGFFRTLKRRVVTELGKNARAGPSFTYGLHVAFSMICHLISWYWCVFHNFWWIPIIVNALSRASLIGIGHEAIHGRYGSTLFELFGAVFLFPSDAWHYEHVMLHHPHTKRPDVDPDEDLAPILRLSANSKYLPHHRVQVLVQLVVGFFAAWGNFIDHMVRGNSRIKSTVFLLWHLLPLFFAPDGGVAATFVSSAISSIITLHAFHVSHIVEMADKHTFDAGRDWGEHQVLTSVNFGTSWWSLSGMLEYQIEHHLFPSLPYEQQHKVVRPLVIEMAKEFNLPYNEFSGITTGVMAHMSHLMHLGQKNPIEKDPIVHQSLLQKEATHDENK